MNVYTNLGLPNDGKSIRLLTIEPIANHASLVVCNLHVTAITPELQFEALSYTWGDPKIRGTISVNGVETSVTKNLASALHALRRRDSPRTLWVDAICIHQEDLGEKAFQVPMMSLIYGKCSRAVIWLGQSDENSRKAFAIIRKGTKEYPRILSKVLQRPWFRRIWIVQEVSLAPTAIVQCGQDTVDWDQFAAVVALIPKLGSMVNPTSEEDGQHKHLHPAFYPRILDSARKRIKDNKPFDLHEALRSFQPFDATMPVDKVFGILSLLSDTSMVEVDYTLSPREVYCNIALAILKHSRNLDLFLDCLQNVRGHPTPGLPSWVPDWSATDQPLDNPILTVTAEEVFQASCGTQLQEPIVHDNGILSLQGCIIGEIADLGNSIPSVEELRKKYWPEDHWVPRRRAFEFVSDMTIVFNSWKAAVCRRKEGYVANLSDLYPTGETLMETFYHSMNVTGGPFPDAKSDMQFTKWMQSIELNIRIFENYGQIVASLPWLLAWLISGPYFAACSFFILYQLLRGRLVYDPPVAHLDASRQTWVVGRTDRDLIGLFPAPSLSSPYTVPTEVGDSIVILGGGARPYIIRSNGERWRLIGNAYVHGIMYGAAFNRDKCILIELM